MRLGGLGAQGCWQVCLKASGDGGGEPAAFLADGCAQLRAAFKFDGLLLRPAPPGAAACTTLVWCARAPCSWNTFKCVNCTLPDCACP